MTQAGDRGSTRTELDKGQRSSLFSGAGRSAVDQHACQHGMQQIDRLCGLEAKASASRAKDPEFESRLLRDLLGSSHTSDLKIGTPVATLPGAWHYIGSAMGLVDPVSEHCDYVR